MIDDTQRGAPLQAVALLLLCSVVYDRYISPKRLSPTVETWWWAVYVMSAPLLFGGVSSYYPLFGLFCTRFVVEVLALSRSHWAVAVSGGVSGAKPIKFGLPVLPD